MKAKMMIATMACLTLIGCKNKDQARVNSVEVDPQGKDSFSVLWHQLPTNADGTPLQDLGGFNIYTTKDGFEWELLQTITYHNSVKITNIVVLNTVIFTSGNQMEWWAVSAFDINGNESACCPPVGVRP